MSAPGAPGAPDAPGAPGAPGAFGVSGLDLDELRALHGRLSETSLGRRAVAELAPRDDAGARAALARAAEVVALAEADDRPALGGLSDPLAPLAAAREFGRPLEVAELASLEAFVAATLRLGAWLAVRAEQAPRLAELGQTIPRELGALHQRLLEVIDHRGEVRDDASPRLGRLRRDIAALERDVVRAVERVAAVPAVRAVLTDTKVHRRGGRSVLAVKARSSGRVRGLVHDRSQSGETAFIEPREAVELGNKLAERRGEERAELAKVLVEITRDALHAEPAVASAAAGMAELELAVVAGRFCETYGARVPELSEDSRLVLKGARHPLLVEEQREGRLGHVVPIDVRLGGDFDLLVITGPNTGGKTLALKTVGVAAFSVRMGWPVCCAEGSTVPLYDDLIADIGDEQEISQSLSTFASHLVRIRAGLERATPRSLVLLDELGGGTDPDEGAALGDALLAHLLERGVSTVVTTHLGRLKEFCFRHARAENGSVAFDGESLAPLYTLLIGTPGESNALAIARRLGIADDVLAKATERLERRDREVLELMAQVRGAREHTEQLRTRAEQKLEELERTRERVRDEERRLAERGELIEVEAQRALEERVAEARRTLERARALLDQLPGPAARELEGVLGEVDASLGGASLTERRKAFLAGLKKGELVWVPRYKKRCVVARIDKARGEVTVKLGRMKLAVPFDEVTWCEA